MVKMFPRFLNLITDDKEDEEHGIVFHELFPL